MYPARAGIVDMQIRDWTIPLLSGLGPKGAIGFQKKKKWIQKSRKTNRALTGREGKN